MRGELFVTGSISPTIVLKRTMANNRFTPERKNTERSEKTAATELRTQSQLLSGVRGQREAEHGHGSDEQARHDQIEEIVESSPSDLDGEGDVEVWLGTALVYHLIASGRNSWEISDL